MTEMLESVSSLIKTNKQKKASHEEPQMSGEEVCFHIALFSFGNLPCELYQQLLDS